MTYSEEIFPEHWKSGVGGYGGGTNHKLGDIKYPSSVRPPALQALYRLGLPTLKASLPNLVHPSP